MQDLRSAPQIGKNTEPKVTGSSYLENEHVESMQTTLDSSNLLGGTPAAPSNSGITAMDLVRQMQRSSIGSTISQRSPESSKVFVQPSLPSLYNTAFAPTMSEKAQLSPRIDTPQKRSPTFNTPDINSSSMFHDQLARQQRDIQMRSSLQQGFHPPTSWDNTFGQTPTGMDSMLRAFEKQQVRTPSPFAGSHMAIDDLSPQNRNSNAPQQAPFGVIGQARPISRGTPTSGQG